MKITRGNAVGEVPRQILQLPFEFEVINVDKVDGNLSVVSWSSQSITTEIDRGSQGGLYNTQYRKGS